MSRNAFSACEREYNEREAQREHAQYERDMMRQACAPKQPVVADADHIIELIEVVEDAIHLLTGYRGSSMAPKWEARARAAIEKARP